MPPPDTETDKGARSQTVPPPPPPPPVDRPTSIPSVAAAPPTPQFDSSAEVGAEELRAPAHDLYRRRNYARGLLCAAGQS